jgi:shikimate dehydrogenase
MRIRGSTRLLAVVGDPVAHSLSPRMHNAAAAALGLDAVYVALRVRPEGLAQLVGALVAAGAGLNVTVPHKRAVVGLLDEAPAVVRRTGACNVVWGWTGGLAGDNTDVAAVRGEVARLLAGRSPQRALVIGSGGSARAAAVAIADGWAGCVVEVLSRDARRSRDFVAWAAGAGVAAEPASGGAVDLVVNATPLGLAAGDPLPLDEPGLRRSGACAVLDLVYVKRRTRFVRAALAAGMAAEDGRLVLLAQGAASFRRFLGVEPPLEVMRGAVEDALRG